MAMKEHVVFEELLPLYAAGGLSAAQKLEVENHLKSCEECRSDLNMWMAVSGEIQSANQDLTASPAWASEALDRVHTPNRLIRAVNQAWQLLRAQTFLVQSEMWPVSAIIMVMGIAVALIAKRIGVLYFLSPLVAASTLAALYGPDHDPAIELSRSTITSPWKILFARMSIVSCYNLVLSFAASLVLLFIAPPGMLGTIILGWFCPFAFLSALALLLSIWLGTTSAIAISYSLWLTQYIPFKAVASWANSEAWTSFLTVYKDFWQNPQLLVGLSIIIVVIALVSVNKPLLNMSPSNN
jgi:hypothetical protein